MIESVKNDRPAQCGEKFRTSRTSRTQWSAVFECRCGQRFVARTDHVKNGHTKSCGCLHRQHGKRLGKQSAKIVDGMLSYGHPLYKIWGDMKNRCSNVKNQGYPRYGGRGITVCKRWSEGDGDRSGFQCFVADVGTRPDGTSLDRIDNDAGYSPANCRWATRIQQSRNSRNCKLDPQKVAKIKRRLRSGDSRRQLAAEFGVTSATISNIATGKTWSDIEPEIEQ